MILARKLMMATAIPPSGQQIYTTSSNQTYIFTVPAGVTSISIMCRGRGGRASLNYSGGGGALSKRNNYPVMPGQQFEVGINGATDGGFSWVLPWPGGPSPTRICDAEGGVDAKEGFHGRGGNASVGIGNVRYSGQAGGTVHQFQGGYSPAMNGGLASALQGRGGGGLYFGNTSATLYASSGAAGVHGGGGAADGITSGASGGPGSVIIIWGPGREFTTSNNY